MFEVISLDNKKRWNEIIHSMKDYDFYFLAEYHQMDKSGLPFLLYYKDESCAFALPVVVRDIEGTTYKDITSIYGYAGPLKNGDNPSTESIINFQKELLRFFDSHSIVSAFSRLHPLFPNQEKVLNELGEVIDTNLTVGIDLTLSESEQKRQYSRSTRHAINLLNKKGIIIREAQNRKDIDSFIDIYEETMKRVNAPKIYYFSPDYYSNFLSSIDSFILLASYKEETIGGILCSKCNGIIQDHLNATKSDYLYLSPQKLLLDEVRKIGVKNHMKYLHLGGGFDGKDNSLFDFKSRFSKQRFMFKIWKYIHNKEVYDYLVEKSGKESSSDISFFPLYRLLS